MGCESILRYGRSVLPPVERDAECALARRVAQADAAARSEMIERNIRMVIHLAYRYTNTGIEIDDLVSAGTLGLIKAVDSYDPERGYRFSTYACQCIVNEILMEIRKGKKFRRECSFDAGICGQDGERDGLALSDVVLAQPDTVDADLIREAESDEFWSALDLLTERERQVVFERYGIAGSAKKTQIETAKKLHLSQSYVSRVEKRALGKLKLELEKIA